MVKGTCLAAPQRKTGTPRRSDPENFGARITRFGVVVGKIWNFAVSGLFL
jgi:hypothetical protein